MPRTYPERRRRPSLEVGRIAAVIIAGSLGAAGIPLASASLFDSQPLNGDNFAVLAQAVGQDRWKLLVLEQIKTRPLCWQERSDGLVTPSLNSFDFSGICSRYLDSNGYSLRTGGEEMDRSFRLRVNNDRQGLVLTAMDPNRGVPIVVARGNTSKRDRDAFVKLTLEPGWNLERRSYKGRTLGHVYFAHTESTATLLAKARGTSTPSGLRHRGIGAPLPPPAMQVASRRTDLSGRGPIRLQVIPFRP